jgi:hypothetical protein
MRYEGLFAANQGWKFDRGISVLSFWNLVRWLLSFEPSAEAAVLLMALVVLLLPLSTNSPLLSLDLFGYYHVFSCNLALHVQLVDTCAASYLRNGTWNHWLVECCLRIHFFMHNFSNQGLGLASDSLDFVLKHQIHSLNLRFLLSHMKVFCLMLYTVVVYAEINSLLLIG